MAGVILEERFLDARRPLRYLIGGSGPPLLLCHGFMGSAENFETWFDELARCVRELDAERGTGGNYAFYLSIPPKFFPTVVEQLKRSGLSDPGPAPATGGPAPWRRVVIEKPFGRDL